MKEDHKISPILAIAVGLGAIIGAGIFVLSGTAISLAGANALLAFVIVGIVAIIIALEFGELGALFPHLRGASYSFVYQAFGSELGFITGILMYFSFATAVSVVALGFGSYLTSILGMTSSTAPIVFAIVLIAVLSTVAAFGLKKAVKTDFILVIIKVVALLVFIGFAIFFVSSTGGLKLGNFATSVSQGTVGALFAASIVIFFAYSGFQTIVTLTPRIKGGGRAAGRATFYAVLISMALYLGIVVALLLMVPSSSFSISGDPLANALKHASAPGWLLVIVDIGALVATASATLAMMLAASMAVYQMGENKLLPKQFRQYNKKRDAPQNAILVSAIIGVVMLFSGNIFIMAAISNFGLLFAYLMTGFAVIHFRRKGAVSDFRMPLYPYLPVIGMVAILLFIIGMPNEALVIGLIMTLSLIVIYYALREVRDKKVVRIRLFK
ncbi:MAG: amino acid permease [Candidatus Marsarchaeota archaeon]|nr:amino acid permease [Candidatus Marsarchaeota archaeon]